MTQSIKKAKWQKRRVEAEKIRVKRELDKFTTGSRERLQYALKRIRDLENELANHGQMKRYVYIVSVLVHNVRFGGLSNSQVNSLVDIAYAILKTHGIEPTTSNLSYLFGELHTALSQLYWKKGEQWKAAWEQQVAFHLSKSAPPGGPGFQALGRAVRSLRLGHAFIACKEFRQALENSLDQRPLLRALLGLSMALRLSGRHDEAARVCTDNLSTGSLTSAAKLEFGWEAMLCRLGAPPDLTEMMAMVKRDKPHYQAAYILEACLWARAVQDRRWLARLPKMSYLVKKRDLQLQKQGTMYLCALTLEHCNDTLIPYNHRLRMLGDMLAKVNSLVSIDKEMLFLAAAARWLARNRTHPLATLVICEYQSLCRRLTYGAQDDVLKLVGDLTKRNWFTPGLQNNSDLDSPLAAGQDSI